MYAVFGRFLQNISFTFFLICVQANVLMINLYSCCIRPCPQYKVLPPLCSYSSPPLQSHQAGWDGPGQRGVHEKITRNFGETTSLGCIQAPHLILWQPPKTFFLCNFRSPGLKDKRAALGGSCVSASTKQAMSERGH